MGRNVAEVNARRVADDLRRRIEAGEFPPGARLPSESQLMAEYGITHKSVVRTVRMLLAADGIVVAEHGRGTFVRRFKRLDRHGSKRHLASQRPAGTTPLEAEATSQGIHKETALVEVTTTPAPADVAGLLGIDPLEPVVVRRHLITLDGHPAATAESYFRPEQVAESRIPLQEAIPGGVHAELSRALGTPLTHAVEALVARMPTPGEIEFLLLPTGTPVVALTRTIYAGDQAVEVTAWLFDASRHRFIYDVPVD